MHSSHAAVCSVSNGLNQLRFFTLRLLVFLWALELKVKIAALDKFEQRCRTLVYTPPFGGCNRGGFLLQWGHMHGIYTVFKLSLLIHIAVYTAENQKHHNISFSFSNIVPCKFQHLSKSVRVKVLIFITCIYKIFKEAVLWHWFISFHQYIFVLRWLYRSDTYWARFSFFKKKPYEVLSRRFLNIK